MAITTDQIKQLRAKTFAGLALCKEALQKNKGDMDKAIEYVNERSDVVGRLYNLTGAKIIHCKLAYEDADKDFEKAVEIIKEKGWEGDINACGDDTKREGVLGVYHHGTDKKIVGVVELFCDTDFVARNEAFQQLAQELAMQVVATNPKYGDKDSVPEDVTEAEKKMLMKSDDVKGKPEKIVEKIVEGKMKKFYEDNCLLEQVYFKDDSKIVRNLVDEAILTLGEKINVGKVYRIELGK